MVEGGIIDRAAIIEMLLELVRGHAVHDGRLCDWMFRSYVLR